MCMSGRLTTAREPRERGCSGSEMVEMRSCWYQVHCGGESKGNSGRVPYISCSSMGSAVSSSLSESEMGAGSNGSTGLVEDGMEKMPRGSFPVLAVEVCPRRVGSSEALRMVGLEFWISAMVL